MLPPPNFTNQFAIIQLDFLTSRASTFGIEAEFSCQWYRRPSQSVVLFQVDGHPGVNRVFSTGLFSYDSILSQIHIYGELSSIKSIEIRYTLGNPDFTQECYIIRWISSSASFLCFILYSANLLSFIRYGIQVEQLLSSAALLVSSIANIPITYSNRHYRNVAAHCVSSFCQGVFSSYNTVALFLFLFRMNGSDILGFAFLMSLLFIVGHALQIVMTDTRILNMFFDGNMDIWMFFVSVSLMGRIGLFTLQIYHAAFAYWKRPRAHVSALYVAAIALEIGAALAQGAVYCVNGHGNFALDFFADYLMQTALAFAFADLHWPVMAPVRKAAGAQRAEDMSRFLPADKLEPAGLDGPFCL